MPKATAKLTFNYKSGQIVTIPVVDYTIRWDKRDQRLTSYEITWPDDYKGPRPSFLGMGSVESVWVEEV